MIGAQLDSGRCWEDGSEFGQEPRIGAVPAVDGLIRVADDTEVGAVANPGTQQVKLWPVEVLELIHENMAKEPLLRVSEGFIGT